MIKLGFEPKSSHCKSNTVLFCTTFFLCVCVCVTLTSLCHCLQHYFNHFSVKKLLYTQWASARNWGPHSLIGGKQDRVYLCSPWVVQVLSAIRKRRIDADIIQEGFQKNRDLLTLGLMRRHNSNWERVGKESLVGIWLLQPQGYREGNEIWYLHQA